MSTLLVWREQLQRLYAKYSMYIMWALQFVLGLCVFGLINSNIGFMKAASSIVCTAGLSAVCAFLPLTVMVLAATGMILLHFYALSLSITLVTILIFLLMYIFYFRFTPKKAWLVLLTPVAFALKIPFVIPVAFGLLGTPIGALPAAFGTVVYYMLHFVKNSSSALKGGDMKGMLASATTYAKQSLNNKEMWVMVIAIVVSLLIVYAIRTRSVNHAWKIGTTAGVITAVVTGTVGNLALSVHLSYVSMILGGALAIVVGLALEFLFFSVNYARTEQMQFEDDEYYYYVKAVPKIGVAVPEMSVKHINERQEILGGQETVVIDSADMQQAIKKQKAGRRQNGGVRAEKQTQPEETGQNTDEILLTRSLTRELGLDLPEQK